MNIRIGSTIPDMAVEAYVPGEEAPRPFYLSDFQGRWLVLFFYPRDFTFICPTEIQSFAALNQAFECEQAVILGASTDSYYCHKAWYESDERLANVTYPVIADAGHRLSQTLGVLLDSGETLRATFIIDPGGIVRHIQMNDLDVGRNVEETLRTVQALRTGALCPHGWLPGEPTLTEQMQAMIK